VRANSATSVGGGFFSGGAIEISESTIAENVAAFGAGLFSSSGAARAVADVTSSTFSRNVASQNGGAVYNSGGALSVTNGTLSSNSGAAGGAIYNIGSANFRGEVALSNVTIASNTAASGLGGGVRNEVSPYTQSVGATARNTILSTNAGGNCSGGPTTSLGHNLSSDASCGFAAGGDLSEVDPRLGPLADNGGPTPTHALRYGSAAIDAGSLDCPPPSQDQRGVSRPQDGDNNGEDVCDVGAFEVEEEADEDDRARPRPATPTPTVTPLPTATATPVPTATPSIFEQRGSVGGIVGLPAQRQQATPVAPQGAPTSIIRPPSTGDGGLSQEGSGR
jgi:hypothetical protein